MKSELFIYTNISGPVKSDFIRCVWVFVAADTRLQLWAVVGKKKITKQTSCKKDFLSSQHLITKVAETQRLWLNEVQQTNSLIVGFHEIRLCFLSGRSQNAQTFFRVCVCVGVSIEDV